MLRKMGRDPRSDRSSEPGSSRVALLVRTLVVVLAVAVVFAALDADVRIDALLVVIGAAVAILLAVFLPHDTVQRLLRPDSLSIAGLAITLGRDVHAAATAVQAVADRPQDDQPIDPADLRLALEARLAYIAKHIEGTPERPAFVNFGSLQVDRVLDEQEARAASELMTLRPAEVRELSPELREAAQTLRRGILALVLHRILVRNVRAAGWTCATEQLPSRRKPGYSVSRTGRSPVHVVPLQVNSMDNSLIGTTRDKLARDLADAARTALIVVPNWPQPPSSAGAGKVAVVRLADLGAALERLAAPAEAVPA